MANIKDAFIAPAAFTITLASLASSNVGVGRQSTLIDNSANLYQAAEISITLKTGATPTANTSLYIYLLRSNNDSSPVVDDNAGASDAGLTVVQATLLGTLFCPSATANLLLTKNFPTDGLGLLGPKWGIAVLNASQAALNASGHIATWVGKYQTAV